MRFTKIFVRKLSLLSQNAARRVAFWAPGEISAPQRRGFYTEWIRGCVWRHVACLRETLIKWPLVCRLCLAENKWWSFQHSFRATPTSLPTLEPSDLSPIYDKRSGCLQHAADVSAGLSMPIKTRNKETLYKWHKATPVELDYQDSTK